MGKVKGKTEKSDSGLWFHSWRRAWAAPVELLALLTDFGRLKTTYG